MFLVFRTRQLIQDEINEVGEYKVTFISPEADSWNPNGEDWDAMEDEILDYDGDIKQRYPPQKLS